MMPLFQQIITDVVQKQLKKTHTGQIPQKLLERESRNLRLDVFSFAKDVLLICIGVASAAFGLQGFLLPNKFIDGGVTGISLLVEVVTGTPLSVLLVLINLPFLLLGIRTISRSFAMKSAVAIVLLAIVVHFTQFSVITQDKLLIAVFGGFFLGMGIGLAIRGGAVIDGTEVMAIWISRHTSLTVGDIILLFNIIIFSFGAYVLSIETALYAILTYLSAAKTVDFVIEGIEEYIGVTIISNFSEEVRLAITEKMGRGVTLYAGKRGFGKRGEQLNPTDIVFTVITRLELSKLKKEVGKIDPDAFIVFSEVKDTKGGMIKKRPLKK
ncbi:MAG: YitT family protein [Saprospiraceae bacterium]|nr:YitT family protein [Saprospiraceae bacterium]